MFSKWIKWQWNNGPSIDDSDKYYGYVLDIMSNEKIMHTSTQIVVIYLLITTAS